MALETLYCSVIVHFVVRVNTKLNVLGNLSIMTDLILSS